MTKEALKLALEALEGADNIDVDMQSAIVRCREALAQPVQPEPVAKLFGSLPVYETTPPQRQWVGLTGKDIIEMWPQTSTVGWDDIRLIEAKLKDKNT